MAKKCLWLLFVVLFLVTGIEGVSRESAITLQNNEYTNILVSISPEVSASSTLVATIKTTFTKASAILYQATNHRAVFRDVTILVPSTWPTDPSYAAATTQVFSNSDIVFVPPPAPAPPQSNPGAGSSATPRRVDVASTKAFAGCGLPGIRITMATDLLTNRALTPTFGAPERILVHEWARFRWGVFNEYPDAGEPGFYFSTITGHVEPIRCALSINGVLFNTSTTRSYCSPNVTDPTTGLFPEECEFRPYPAGPSQSVCKASIMDKPTIQPLVQFCDDDQSNSSTAHNYEAPSHHNLRCGHRSTWAVISESSDFNNGNNPPRPGLSTTPVFTVVQAPKTRRLVVAIDTSSIMAVNEKLREVHQAATTVQRENTSPDVDVVVTSFGGGDEDPLAAGTPTTTPTSADFLSDDERVDLDSVIINVTQGNDLLASTLANTPPSVPAAVRGGSPSGRRKRSLGASTSWQPGGHVVIVTEGHRVADVDLTSVVARLQKAGVIVSLVLLGGPPPPSLLPLAHKTGGRLYHDNNHHESTGVTDAFLHLLSFAVSHPHDAPVQVYSRSTKLKKNGTVVGQVAVDHLVATRIKFILFYTASHQAVLEVEPPPHLARASNLDCHVDRVLRVIRCEMPVEGSGVWRYSVTSPEAQRVSLLVLASPANTSGSPVRLSGGLVVSHLDDQLPIMRIFAEATQGDRAVPGLTVEATVFGPEGDPVTVVLLDNGAGADIQEGDGVYSRYFFELTHSGIYNVRLSAFGSWAQHGSKGEQEDHHKYVTRTAIAGSTLIHPNMTNQHGRDRDLLPPARIPDLLVVRTIREDKVVVLTWTASGDDLDKSRASKYLILLGHSVSDLMTHASSVNTLVQEDVIHGNLSSPKEFGEREYLALRIPSSFSKGQGFALMVMAVDEAGNKGKHSNYVTASFDHPTIHKKHWQEAQKMFQDVVIKRPRHRRQETNFLQVSQEAINSNDQERTKNINKMILPQEMEPLLTKHQRSKRSESKKDADTRADVSRNVNTGIAILLVGCVLAFLVTTLPTCLARRATRGERGKTDTGNLFQVKIDR